MGTRQMDTIFDRPAGIRFIGVLHMMFGAVSILAAAGIAYAWRVGVPQLAENGLLYVLAIILGVTVPCLVIGNYVDDLRKSAVVAQLIYSIAATILCTLFVEQNGIGYSWTVPFFDTTANVNIGYLATFITIIELCTVLYILARWKSIVPPPGVKIERDRRRARLIERGLLPSPLDPRLLAPDGVTPLTPEQQERILDVRRLETREGMAILCSNCGGATPVTEASRDNTVKCNYCGVTLGLGGVFVPCKNHPEYLAATTCAVCGEPFCRRCLTAQAPPIDSRWRGSTIFLCERCFEGRYRPAVTTTSLVIPIDSLFSKAGSRFSRFGAMYKKFLGMYSHAMKYVLQFAIRVAGEMARAGGRNNNAGAFLLIVILAIIAIPVIVFALMLAAAIVIVPALFYAGLVAVMIQAVRIIRKTDFISLEEARDRGLKTGRLPEAPDTAIRDGMRPWESPVNLAGTVQGVSRASKRR